MNLDHLKQFPNQLIEGSYTECAGITVADICGNIDGIPYDYDYVYANALRLANTPPTTAGSDPYEAMLSAVVYGLVPYTMDETNAAKMGELYVANWKNYSPQVRTEALKHSRRGVKTLYTYQDIVDHILTTGTGVSIAMKWYDSFRYPNQDGTLPAAVGITSNHDVAAYELTSKGLRIKPWLGSSYGDGGYCYMTEATFSITAFAAYGFDPNAWRWMSLAKIAVTHPWSIPDILPIMQKTP